MELSIGQKVSYPNQGVCLVQDIEQKRIGGDKIAFYSLRVLSDNSTIFVPTENAEAVGIRPIICTQQYEKLLKELRRDFADISSDWKIRSREFNEKLQSGDIFEAADVLKKLTFLSNEKKLSFREQTLLEKAKYLIVSELISADISGDDELEKKIDDLVLKACDNHEVDQTAEGIIGLRVAET